MGVADRQYMQRSRSGGGFPRSTVGRLLILCGAVFLLQLALGRSSVLFEWFALSRGQVLSGKVWTLVTYALLHADFQHVFWNGVGIWIFGSLVEGAMAPREFVRFTVFAALFSGLLFVVTDRAPVVGISGVVSAYVVAGALRFPKMPFHFLFLPFSMPLWLVAALYVAGDLAGAGRSAGNVAHFAHLGGAAYGAICWRFGVVPSFSFRSKTTQKDRNAPGYEPAERLERGDHERRRVDALLEKISAEGIGSLSDEERTFLNEASKRYR